MAADPARKGLSDGLRVNRWGHVFSTGPGGVRVPSPDGKCLDSIPDGQAVVNSAFGDNNGVTLYKTEYRILWRVKTAGRGKGL